MRYSTQQDSQGRFYVKTHLFGHELIREPLLNKGMSFSRAEREAFYLDGLIPCHEATLEEQIERSYETFQSKDSDLEKYIYMRDLQDSNETLFYALLVRYIAEMMPIVYTPVVGLGCQQFSHAYRRPRGLYIAYPHQDRIHEILANPDFDAVEAIVVSDGERILGLGDQGAGGMGIPIGKLSLYSACAGIHPALTLPILLDTGTNNAERIADPLYIGWRHERVRGQAYEDFIEAFVTAIQRRFPKVLLQWEDFAQPNANPILAKYRDRLCTFNDDIQGTAAIATGALLSAVQVTGTPLREHRIAVLGGGSAGCGISHLLMQALVDDGLSEQEALSRFFVIDRNGLLTNDMPALQDFQKPFAKERASLASWSCQDPHNISLLDVVKNAHPTVLIGVCAQTGAFTEEIVREMASHVKQPVIFPLSNPTSRSEATPEDLMKWTQGQVVVGTGSPFPPILREGKSMRVDQTNNAYIFPGMGLGLIAVQATRVTDKMFLMAAQALANCSPAKQDPKANLLPPLETIREISFEVALAVALEAVAAGLAPALSIEEIREKIKNKMWEPKYLPYRTA